MPSLRDASGTGHNAGEDELTADGDPPSYRFEDTDDDVVISKADADETKFDMIPLVTRSGFNRFTVRFGLLITGLLWFLSGSQISLTLFVTLEPPKFPDCSLPHATFDVPSVSERLLQTAKCNPDVPLPTEDCTSPYVYKHPAVSVVSSFDVPLALCDSRPWKNVSWIHSALFGGIMCGAIFITPLCDKIGRRPVLTFGTLLLTVASLVAAGALSIEMFGIARFLVGMGSAASSLPSMVLLSELVPSDKRAYTVGVQALSFALAAGYVAGLACIIPSWRVLTLMVTLPGFFFCFGCVCIGGTYIESPKWLSAKGRMDEAFSTWLRIASMNKVELDESLDLDKFTRLELQSAHQVKLRSQSDVDEELSLMSVQQLASPDSLRKAFTTFPTSIWLWVSIWMWVVAAFVYYGVLLDFEAVIGSMSNSAPADPIIDDTVPRRLLRQSPQSFDASSPHSTYSSEHTPWQLSTGFVEMRQMQVAPPSGVVQNEAAETRPLVARPLELRGEPAEMAEDDGMVKENGAAAVDISATPQVIPAALGTLFDPERKAAYMEYLANLGGFIRNGTGNLMDSARQLPQEAQRLYGEFDVDNKIHDFYSDLSAQFVPADPMAPFWHKMRMQGVLVLASFAAEIPAYVFAMFLASTDLFGRKRTTTCMFFVGGVCILGAYTVQYWGLEDDMQAISMLGLAVLGRCFVAAVFMLLYMYCAELVPTSVRAGAVGMLSASARIGCVFAAPLASYLETQHSGLALAVFGILSITAACMTLTTLPETLYKPLYDNIETLELAYERNGFNEWFFQNPANKAIGVVGRYSCCIGRVFSKCVGLPGHVAPTDFESRGRAWLKRRWARVDTRKLNQYGAQARMVGGKVKKAFTGPSRKRKMAKFMPLADMHDDLDSDSRDGMKSRLPGHIDVNINDGMRSTD